MFIRVLCIEKPQETNVPFFLKFCLNVVPLDATSNCHFEFC